MTAPLWEERRSGFIQKVESKIQEHSRKKIDGEREDLSGKFSETR